MRIRIVVGVAVVHHPGCFYVCMRESHCTIVVVADDGSAVTFFFPFAFHENHNVALMITN